MVDELAPHLQDFHRAIEWIFTAGSPADVKNADARLFVACQVSASKSLGMRPPARRRLLAIFQNVRKCSQLELVEHVDDQRALNQIEAASGVGRQRLCE